MKISLLLKVAMANNGINTAAELSKLTGIYYGTVVRAMNDQNVGISVIVDLLDFMGYQLKAEIKE